MTNGSRVNYALTDHFYTYLGKFYGLWIALDSTIDYEIGQLLGLAPIKTHALVAGMEFGRKASLFRILLGQSDLPKKTEIDSLLVTIQNEAKRNIFTHSIIHSLQDEVTFVHRRVQNGVFSVGLAKFTRTEFESHVREIKKILKKLGDLLAIDRDDYEAFCDVAYKASKSDSTSPEPPSFKA
jgi:hypothetical protein